MVIFSFWNIYHTIIHNLSIYFILPLFLYGSQNDAVDNSRLSSVAWYYPTLSVTLDFLASHDTFINK
jgi:hypothetical protein